MPLPSPETCMTYASILRKERRDKDGLAPPGEIALAAAEALEYAARNVNADSALASQLAQAMVSNGRLTTAINDIEQLINREPPGIENVKAVIRSIKPTPQHHSFDAVGITTDKPGGGM